MAAAIDTSIIYKQQVTHNDDSQKPHEADTAAAAVEAARAPSLQKNVRRTAREIETLAA